jgi:hypothetical protein
MRRREKLSEIFGVWRGGGDFEIGLFYFLKDSRRDLIRKCQVFLVKFL